MDAGNISPETAKTIHAAAGWTKFTGTMLAWWFLTFAASVPPALFGHWSATENVAAFDWVSNTVSAALLSVFVGPDARVAERNFRIATKRDCGPVIREDITKQLVAAGISQGEIQSWKDGFVGQLGPAPELLPGVPYEPPSDSSHLRLSVFFPRDLANF